MNPYAYVGTLCVLLWAAWTGAWRLADAFRIPRCLAAMVAVGSAMYVSWLIPGSLSYLSQGPVVLCLAVGAGLLVAASRRIRAGTAVTVGGLDPAREVHWTSSDYVIAIIGLLGCGTLLHEVGYAVPYDLLFPSEAKTGIDVASYHVPCMVRFLQCGTLWDMQNSWQSYSYGYEFIGNLLSFAFHKTWGLWLGHLFALGLSVVALVQITHRVLWAWQPARILRPAPVALLVVGLWSLAFSHAIRQVGKNDVFLAACVLSGFALLLEWAEDVRATRPSPVRQRVLLCLMGAAAGLALATKPTAALYVLFFSGAVAVVRLTAGGGAFRRRWVPALADGLLVGGLAGAMGGFFLVRNLRMVGALSALKNGYRDLLAPHLLEGFVYRLRPVSLGLVFGAVGLAATAAFVQACRRDGGRRAVLALFGAFTVASAATFVLSPNVILGNFYNVRFAICMMSCAMVLSALACAHVCAVFFRLRPLARSACIFVLLLLGVLAVARHWERNPVSGLPGWNRTWHGRPTEVYAWADTLEGGQCILVVGTLYPLGFQGRDWQNHVVADPLSRFSHAQEINAKDPDYVAAAIVAYRPDVVVTSTGEDGVGRHAEIVRWLAGRPDLFDLAYRDDAAMAFRILPEAYEEIGRASCRERV